MRIGDAMAMPHRTPDEAMEKLEAIRGGLYPDVFIDDCGTDEVELLMEILDCIIVILKAQRDRRGIVGDMVVEAFNSLRELHMPETGESEDGRTDEGTRDAPLDS